MTERIERLILGSSSPYRHALLASSGLTFERLAPLCKEEQIADEHPATRAKGRARLKALSIATKNPGALVIGADQVLEFNGQALGKVDEPAAALSRLEAMAGTVHLLHSAWTLAYLPRAGSRQLDKARRGIHELSEPGLGSGSQVKEREVINGLLVENHLTTVTMTMRKMTPGELKSYVETDEWRGSAGCYKFEEVGRNLFIDQSVDETAIIGLPLVAILGRLRTLGINPLLKARPPWTVAGLARTDTATRSNS